MWEWNSNFHSATVENFTDQQSAKEGGFRITLSEVFHLVLWCSAVTNVYISAGAAEDYNVFTKLKI